MRITTLSLSIIVGLALSAVTANAADAPAPAPATAAAPAAMPPADASMPNGGQRKPCEELKTEMAARMDAKGVKGYTLRTVPNAEAEAATGEKIVGSCDGGTQKILYKRGW